METMRNTSPLLLLLGYYLIINLILYLAMAVDKKRAVKNAWRIPEKNLYFLAVLGGGVGGLIAMYTKHHKNKHIDFKFPHIPVVFIQRGTNIKQRTMLYQTYP